MTSTRDFLPGLMTKRQGDPYVPLSKEHKARRGLFALYWAYYRGHHRKTIKVKASQADDNVTLNWSKKIVDAGVAFLFGKLVSFEIDGEPDRTKAEQYLDTVWANDPRTGFNAPVFLKQLSQNGAVDGTAFVKLHPPDDWHELPYMRAIDPAIVDIITDHDDVEIVNAYHLVWKSGDDWKRQRIERDGIIWRIVDEIYTRGDKWRIEDEMAWEYDFPPLFHCQNLILANSQWGISDLEDADVNDAVNFAASNINRIIRFHAHPKTIGTGFAANQLQTTAVDQFWAIPSPEAKVFNLEMATDLASSRQHKTDLEEALHQIAGVPRLDPERVNLGALSGFALQILYGPLLAKTDDKRGTYGGMLQQINRALLVLGGYEDEIVNNVWQSPLPGNAVEKAQLFATLAGATGGNTQAAAKVAGYSRDEVDALGQGDFFVGVEQ